MVNIVQGIIMDIRHLRYFVAVVETQSFTKASERLFIAQPPLSRQIQNLEDELGLQLLERGTRPVKTTEAGQFFYQHAKRIIANLEQAVSMTKRMTMTQDTLRIGFVGSLLLGLLPKIIYEFRQIMPNTQIEMIELGTASQIEALKLGKIDIGFGRLSISDASVKRILLRNEPLILAMHQSHPLLVHHKHGLYLADIVDEPLLLYPDFGSHNFATYILSIFHDHGLHPKNTQSMPKIEIALGLAASGEGVCIVPKNSQVVQMDDLVYVPILDGQAVSPIYLTFRHETNDYSEILLNIIYNLYSKNNVNHNLDFIKDYQIRH